MSESPANSAAVAPRPRLLVPAILIVLSALLAAASAFLGGSVYILLGIIALVWAVLQVWRTGAASHATRVRSAGRTVLTAAAIIVLLAHGAAFILWYRAFADIRYISVYSGTNLRALGSAITGYSREERDFPSDFATLVNEGWTAPKLFLAPGDYRLGEAGPGEPLRTSYVYRPGTDANRPDPVLILAYERVAALHTDYAYFSPRGRLVLFADGRVECLTDDAFRAALADDERRRTEIGWPTVEPEPGIMQSDSDRSAP